MRPANVFLQALRWGRLIGFLLIVGIAGGMWAVETVENALWFEEVDAVAEHVDLECITRDEQMEAATPCEQTSARLKKDGDPRLTQVFRVRTQYKSPADGQPQINAAVLQRPSDRPNTPTASFNQPNFGAPPQDANGQTSTISFGGNQPGNSALPPITLLPGQAGQPGGLPPITLAPVGGANQPGGLPPITLGTPGTQPGTQGGAGFRVGGGVAPQFPGQVPGQVQGQIPGQIPGQTPGQTPGQVPGQVPGQFPFPGQTGPGGLPGGIQTGVPPGFRIDPNGQLVPITQGQPQQGTPGAIPGQPVGQQPGGAQDPNSALNLINQLLTNPRQTPTTQNVPTSGNQVGAIAGIASTHKGPSIKVYKDQDHYELWEFVFSPTASTVPGGGAAPPVRPGGGTNQPGGQPNTFGGQPSPFGQPGGLGGQPGGFGGQPGGGQPGGLFQTAPVGR